MATACLKNCWIKSSFLFSVLKKAEAVLGLSLCKQIMMLHKGNIQVHSVEGEGTAFQLLF